ncbi:MAG: hypothetical protein H9W82_13325 [Lactobacillus sp.]|nr:hypothetical protein [Lactobacillus sp.]
MYSLSVLLLVSLALVSLLVIKDLKKEIKDLKFEIFHLENDKALLEIEKRELITGLSEDEK